MIVLISPAKKLASYETARELIDAPYSSPIFLQQSSILLQTLQSLSQDDIQIMMRLSSKLAKLNFERYRAITPSFQEHLCAPALGMFQGDTYRGLDVSTLSKQDLAYADNHLRILSGFYGLLAPRDGIQPHRLEMSTPLPVAQTQTKNLYEFWGDRITQKVQQLAAGEIIINCASQEYIRSIHTSKLRESIIDIIFQEHTPGSAPRTIGIHAKKARGSMARYIIQQRCRTPQDIQSFAHLRYRYTPERSSRSQYVFIRPSQ